MVDFLKAPFLVLFWLYINDHPDSDVCNIANDPVILLIIYINDTTF